MASKFPFDVAVASALGAIIALSIALTLGWSPYWWPLVGLIVGPLCYRPWEILGAAFTLGRDLWKGVPNGIPLPRPNYRTIGVCLWMITRVLACVLLAGISLIAIPTAIALILDLPMLHAQAPEFWSMVTIMVFSTLVGLSTVITLLGPLPTIPARWTMPISRQWLIPLFGKKGYAKGSAPPPSWTWKHTWQACGLMAPLSQLSVCLVPLLVMDLLITIALACASNKRIASMVGSTLGCTAAAIMAMTTGVILPILVITLGMVVGWLMGPMFYLLREYLSNHHSTVLVSPTS